VHEYAEFCIKDMNIMADCAYNRQCVPSMWHYVHTCVSVCTYAFIVILYSVAKGGRMRNVEIAPSLRRHVPHIILCIILYIFCAKASGLWQSYIGAICYVKYLRIIKNCASNTPRWIARGTMHVTFNYVCSLYIYIYIYISCNKHTVKEQFCWKSKNLDTDLKIILLNFLLK